MLHAREGADIVGTLSRSGLRLKRATQGRGFAVRPLSLDDELLPDEELPCEALLPDDDGGGGGGLYVLRGRSEAVPLELPCVCV